MSNEDRRAELQRLIALTEPQVQANRRSHCFWPDDEFFGRPRASTPTRAGKPRS